MRPLVLLCLIAGTAGAEVPPILAEEPAVQPLPKISASVGVMGTAGKLARLDLTGWAPNVELARGAGRWQYFGEVGFGFVKLGPKGDRVSGHQVRGGAGVRWLARSFELGDKGAIEMHLEAFAGYSRFDLEGRAHTARPDLGAGVGYGVRSFVGKRLRNSGIRITVRVFFAPTDRRDEEIACRGSCPMTAGNSNAGLMAMFGGYL